MKPSSRIRRSSKGCLAALLTLTQFTDPLGAADVNWTAGSNANFDWATTSNWSGNVVPTSSDDVFLPKPVPNPGVLLNPDIITLGAGSAANSLTLFGSYTLTGGTLSLTSGQITARLGNPSTIQSQMTGAGGLIKLGDGAVRLTNATNNYTGITRIDAGSLIVLSQGALGADASAVVITGNTTRGSGGGNLTVGGDITFTRDIQVTGGGPTGDGNALNSVGNNTFTGSIAAGVSPGGLNPAGGAPITATGTRLASTFGTATISGPLSIAPSGQVVEFAGNGQWLITSDMTGAGGIQKSGGGTLVLTGNNTGVLGAVSVAGGSLRISDVTNLSASTATNAIDLNGGTLEIRSNNAGGFAAKKVDLGVSTTLFVDRALGTTGAAGLNQNFTFSDLVYTSTGDTLTITGRNGNGASFTGASGNVAVAAGGNMAFTNNSSGLVTLNANFFMAADATARSFAIGGTGNVLMTGSFLLTGANHFFTKSGTGTMTLEGNASTYLGVTNISGGTLVINEFGALNNAVGSGAINIGSTGTTAGTLTIAGHNITTPGALTTAKVVNLNGTTAPVTINANQTGTSPAVVFTSNFTATLAGTKTVTLGGSNTLDNEIQGAIVQNGTTNLVKSGTGTWMLSGTNAYTGTTSITNGTLKIKANGAASTVIADASGIIFNTDGGRLHFVSQAGGSLENLGSLTATAGAGTLVLERPVGASGPAQLTFASAAVPAKGSSLNVVNLGPGVNGTDFLTTVTGLAAGYAFPHLTFGGGDFAYNDATGFLRAPVYGVDATFGAANALGANTHLLINGAGASTGGALTVVTAKLEGSTSLTLGGLLTVKGPAANASGGILATGGASTISGTGISTGGTGDLVIRVDGGTDVLTLNAPVTVAGGLTKNGAGTLIIAGVNAQGSSTNINEGTVRMSGSGRLSGNTAALNLRAQGTLDLNGTSTLTSATTSAIGTLIGNGTVTNSSALPSIFAFGTTTTNTFGGVISETAGRIDVIKFGTAGATFSGISTYTGSTTIASTGLVTVSTLDNIGMPSGIGKGDGTSTATNAASLVITGTGGIAYSGAATVATDRLFTFGGTGARFNASGANNAALVFTNTNAPVFSVAAAQTLTLGGTSIGDNYFGPAITDNTNAGFASTSLTKADAGLWILGNNSNSYTGVTTITGGALRATDGTTLPTASPLVINGGVFQSSGDFVRPITSVATAGQVVLTAGGFAAGESKLTVSLGGLATPSQLMWGSGGFLTTGNLILNSTTSLAEVEFRNAIYLETSGRTIQVDTNTSTSASFATMSGVLSGEGGITKSGNGVLQLTGANTYQADTAITAGTLRITSLGSSSSTSSSIGAGTGKLVMGNAAVATTLAYVGEGETSNRLIEMIGSTGTMVIESSGTGALVLSNLVNLGTGTRTLALRGDLNAGNEISSVLTNGTGTLAVTKDDNGTWILSGDNTYSGVTTASVGALGLGRDSTGPVGGVTSGPVGIGRLVISNGSVFAFNGDRVLNNDVQFSGNAISTFIGENSITLNGNLFTTAGGTTTITNSLAAGKVLTINSPVLLGAETGTTGRTVAFNGSGDTVLNTSVQNSASNALIALQYSGYGTLTLGGLSTYTGNTTISSGTMKLAVDQALPSGTGKGLLVMSPVVGISATLDLNGRSQTFNGVTANSAGTILIDNTSASPASITVGANNGTVDGTVAFRGGITNSGGGALSFTKAGSIAATMSQGPFSYTGSTTTSSSLTFTADVSGTTGLTVSGAGSSLAFSGGLSASSGIQSVSVGAGSALDLRNGVGQTMTNLTSLSLAAGSALYIDAGTITDTLGLVAPNVASVTGAVTLHVNDTGTMTGGTTFNLLTAPAGGLISGGGSTGSYVLGTIPGGFSSLALNQTDTLVSLTTGTLVSGSLYWTGASNTVWNSVNGTFQGLNWSPSKTGSPVSAFVPGTATSVIFQADGAAGGAVTTTLGQNFQINNLEFEASTNIPTSVTIAPGTVATNRLTIDPVNTSSADGINLKAGGPTSVTISAPVGIGSAQTWNVATAGSTLTVSGALSGSGALTKAGAGTVVISAAADPLLFAVPTVAVNGGRLEIGNPGALGTTAAGNAATVSINAGGLFSHNNNAGGTVNNPLILNGGTLTSGGFVLTTASTTRYNGLITVAADSLVLLQDNGGGTPAHNVYLDNVLSGPGKVTVDSVTTGSSGNQITGGLILGELSAGNPLWAGGLQVNRGTVYFRNLTAQGTGAITANFGRFIFDRGTNGQTQTITQTLGLDGPSGNAVLELQVNNFSTTLGANFTLDFTNAVTLGGGGASPFLRLYQGDTSSALSFHGGIVLAANGSIHSSGGVTAFTAPNVVIETVGISETGGPRSLLINGDTAWVSTSYQNIQINAPGTYTGGTTLAAGRLIFGIKDALGSGPLTITGGILRAAVDLTTANGNTAVANPINLNGTLTMDGSEDLELSGPVNFAASRSITANGNGGASLRLSGAITSTANASLTLSGTGIGIISGGYTQPAGTAVSDVNLSSGNWTFTGANSSIADDLNVNGGTLNIENTVFALFDDTVVMGTSTVMNINGTGVMAAVNPAGTSSGLYARNGATVNLNADDVYGVANSGGLDFILLSDTTAGPAATLNTNTFRLFTPRLDLGQTAAGLEANIIGSGVIEVGTTATLYRGRVSAQLAGAGAIIKSGLGDVTLSGDNSGLTGATAVRVDAGNLFLDYTLSNTDKLRAATGLDMRGGNLIINGSATANTTQTVAGLLLNTSANSGGTSVIDVNNGAGFSATLNLGSITRANSAGTIRFFAPTTGAITTTRTNDATGILGAWATSGNATGTYFARNDGADNIVPLTYAAANNDITSWVVGEHVTDGGAGLTGTANCATDIASLRLDAAGGSTANFGARTPFNIATGGILMTDKVTAGPASILGGVLTSGTGELIFTQDSASQSLTVSSTIAGTTAVTKAGVGTLRLTGNNTYTGITQISNGIVQVSGGNAIGDTSPVMLSDDHSNMLQLLDDETIGRLSGGSANTGLLNALAVVDVGSHTLTINNVGASTTYAGVFTGTGNITRIGTGSNTNLIFSGVSTGFTGTITVNGGLLYLEGLGAINASDITINKTGSFMISNNGTTSSGNRLLNNATITLNSADGAWAGETKPSGLVIRRDQGSTQNETVGVITVNSGASYTRLDATVTNAVALLIADNIVRQNDATLNVRGTNMTATTGARSKLQIGTAANQTAFIDAMVGGDNLALGAENISIVPWAIAQEYAAGLGDANMGNTLATYVTGQGFRGLNLTTEYNTFATKLSNQDNIRLTGTTSVTGIAGQTINALVLDNANTTASTVNITGTGAGQTLEVTSGALLFTLSAAPVSTAHNIVLGGFDAGITVGSTNEYVIHVVNPSSVATTATLTATISSPLSSAANITKSGRGTLILSGTNAAGGGANRTTINEGVLQISNLANIGGLTGDVVLAGGTLRLGAGFVGDMSGRDITLAQGGGTFDINTNSITTSISGVGPLTKTGTGTLTIGNGLSRGAGLTTVAQGTVLLNNTLGNSIGPDGLLVSGSSNPTTVRLLMADQIDDDATVEIRTNGSNNQTVDLNNFTETINGLTLTSTSGTGTTLKTGANGVLTVTGDIVLNNNRTGDASTNEFQVLITGSGVLGTRTTDGFLDLAGGNRTITVATTITAPTRNDAVIETVIRNGGIIKEGARILYLRAANTYAGPTQINAGTIAINDTANLGNGSVTNTLGFDGGALLSTGALVDLGVNRSVSLAGIGGRLEVSASNRLTVSGAITGFECADLIKDGTGTLALTNSANSYAGLTLVNAGTLQVGVGGVGRTGTGATTVSAGATLSGSGLVGGATADHSISGILRPGDVNGTSLGVLSFEGDLGFNAGSSAFFSIGDDALLYDRITGTSANDVLTLNGSLTIRVNNGGLDPFFEGSYVPQEGDSWTLLMDWVSINLNGFDTGINYRQNGTGGGGLDLPDISAYGGGVLGWDVSAFGTTGTISIVNLVPEPSRAILLLVGVASLVLRRRRKF